MAITDLTGTYWKFHEEVDWSTCPYNLEGETYNGFALEFKTLYGSYHYVEFAPWSSNWQACYEDRTEFESGYQTVVYGGYSSNGWLLEKNMIINITGGDYATNSDFATWLNNNADEIVDFDLTGTTWTFNEAMAFSMSERVDFSFNFISDGIECEGLSTAYFSPERLVLYDGFGGTIPYRNSWGKEAYRTIQITGGQDATNPFLGVFLASETATYEISYSSEYGTPPSDKSVGIDYSLKDADIPTLTEEGFAHTGWFYESTFVTLAKYNDKVKNDITLYAKWREVIETLVGTSWRFKDTINITSLGEKNIIFTDGNGKEWKNFELGSSSLYYNADYPYETDTEYVTAYGSSGWRSQKYRTVSITGGSHATDPTLIGWFLDNGDMLSDCTLHYSTAHGTAPDDKTVEFGHILTSEDLPTLSESGWTFIGWDKSIGDEITENTTITASWEQVPSYTIEYQTPKGTTPQSKSELQGYTLKASDLPTLTATGFTHLGWYYDSSFSNKANTGDALTHNIILYAKWQISDLTGTSWKIKDTFSLANVDFNSLNFTADYGTRNYTRFRVYQSALRYYYSGTSSDYAYRNSAWQQTGYKTIHITGGTYATNQTAIDWFLANATQVIPTYTVTFNANGHGTAPPTQTVNQGERAVRPPNPTEQGFYFDGWYTEQACINEFDFETPITANRTLYAKWIQAQTYTLTYSSAHGNPPAQRTVVENYALTLEDLPTLQEEGYEFLGWDKPVGYVINANTTITASWRQLTRYEVTYENEKGETPDDFYFYETHTLTAEELPTYTDEDFIFAGWFDGDERKLPDDVLTSDTNLVARWVEKPQPYVEPEPDYNGNRHNEKYTFYRVSGDNWQEHETYNYITGGSVEYSTSTKLKVTAEFEFDGYELPNVNDLIRVYYSFTDDDGVLSKDAIATLLVSFAEKNLIDTIKGVETSGKLDGLSVLSILLNAKVGRPYTIKKNSNAVFEAEKICREFGLQVNAEPSSFSLTSDHTFVGGTDYLEIVNWCLTSASFSEAYPDAMGVVQMVSNLSIQNKEESYVFKNDSRSIMLPEVSEINDWQNAPNVVRLLYNLDDACISSYAKNVSGSRASLENRGNREITYFEEVSDLGVGDKRQSMKNLAETMLMEKSADVEYVTIQHAYVPICINDVIKIKYADYEWTGNVDNMSIELAPSTETETKIKRTLSNEIYIESGAEVLR